MISCSARPARPARSTRTARPARTARPTRIALLALLAFAAVVASASAHRAQVVPAGANEIDLGLEPGAQLIHGTLQEPTDMLTARFGVPRDGSFAVDVLVPDQPQERGAKPKIQLGSCGRGSGTGARSSSTTCAGTALPLGVDHKVRGGVLVDAATKFRYRRIDRFTSADGLTPGRELMISVARGGAPMRVAIRTDDGSPFRLDQASKQPRTVARISGWFAQPAPGSPQVGGDDSGDVFRGLVWLPLSFAGIVVLIAAWWMARGRGTARRRGVERAAEERPPSPPPS
jgi:hypothetical protein